MKLLRFGPKGQEKPGLLDKDGQIRDLSGVVKDIDGSVLADLSAIRAAKIESLPVVPAGVRIAEPVGKVGKFLCIGLNYADHAKESNMALPAEPILFFKSTSALTGPYDGLELPRGSEKTDWEIELAVIVGRRAKYVSEAEALAHVAGYCLHNDYSERAFQLERGGQWVKGKSCDTFATLGPFLATPDEIANVNSLRMWLSVNGQTKQNGTTANLAFKVPHLISYISQFMTLEPGDVISTGTPAGVGLGFKPPQYLRAGDVVELGIDGLGEQRQVVRAAS